MKGTYCGWTTSCTSSLLYNYPSFRLWSIFSWCRVLILSIDSREPEPLDTSASPRLAKVPVATRLPSSGRFRRRGRRCQNLEFTQIRPMIPRKSASLGQSTASKTCWELVWLTFGHLSGLSLALLKTFGPRCFTTLVLLSFASHVEHESVWDHCGDPSNLNRVWCSCPIQTSLL